jgi:hypothetical protein
MSCENSNCQHAMLQDNYSTTVLEKLTSWAVVSVTFSFLATCFPCHIARLSRRRGETSLRLVGLSLMRGYGAVQVG